MIETGERAKMMRAHSIGPKMIAYLERSGIHSLEELAGRDAQSVLLQIEVETGIRLNRMGLAAIANLIALADAEGSNS